MTIAYHHASKVKQFFSKFLPGFISQEKHLEELGEVKEKCLIEKLELAQEREEAKVLSKKLELERFLNKTLLFVSKDGLLSVAYGKRLINEDSKEINIECLDLYSNILFVPNGKIFVYTEQKLDALLLLGPYQRVALIFYAEHEIAATLGKSDLLTKEQMKHLISSCSS